MTNAALIKGKNQNDSNPLYDLAYKIFIIVWMETLQIIIYYDKLQKFTYPDNNHR